MKVAKIADNLHVFDRVLSWAVISDFLVSAQGVKLILTQAVQPSKMHQIMKKLISFLLFLVLLVVFLMPF